MVDYTDVNKPIESCRLIKTLNKIDLRMHDVCKKKSGNICNNLVRNSLYIYIYYNNTKLNQYNFYTRNTIRTMIKKSINYVLSDFKQ